MINRLPFGHSSISSYIIFLGNGLVCDIDNFGLICDQILVFHTVRQYLGRYLVDYIYEEWSLRHVIPSRSATVLNTVRKKCMSVHVFCDCCCDSFHEVNMLFFICDHWGEYSWATLFILYRHPELSY